MGDMGAGKLVQNCAAVQFRTYTVEQSNSRPSPALCSSAAWCPAPSMAPQQLDLGLLAGLAVALSKLRSNAGEALRHNVKVVAQVRAR